MHRKLITACMMVAAFAAFVIVPAASASPVITHTGVPVPNGKKLTATNTGNIVFTGTGGTETTCDHMILTAEVTKNSGTVIEGKITTRDFNGTGTSTDCTSNLFNSAVGVTVGNLCLKVSATPADEVVTTGCGAAVTFTLNFTALGITCKYSRNEVKAKFTTGSSQVTVNNTEEVSLVEGGGFCPSGSFLDMTLDFYTEDGTDPNHTSPIDFT